MIILCQECDSAPACWWDSPPRYSATACDFWCHMCIQELPSGWTRDYFEQRPTETIYGTIVDLPYFLVNGEWIPWGTLRGD